MTKDEAFEIVRANRILFPMDFLRFEDSDFESMAMLYAKALGKYSLKEVREAFVECSKTCQHCIKIADLNAKLSRFRGRDALAMRPLKRSDEK